MVLQVSRSGWILLIPSPRMMAKRLLGPFQKLLVVGIRPLLLYIRPRARQRVRQIRVALLCHPTKMPALQRHHRLLIVPRMARLLCHRLLPRLGRAHLLYLPTSAGLPMTGTKSSWRRGRWCIGARCLAPPVMGVARAG